MACCEACAFAEQRKQRGWMSAVRAAHPPRRVRLGDAVDYQGVGTSAAKKAYAGDTAGAGEDIGSAGGGAAGAYFGGPGGAAVGSWLGGRAGRAYGSLFSGREDCKPGTDPADPECDGEQVIVGVQLGKGRPATAAFPGQSTADTSEEARRNQLAQQEAAQHTDAERDADANARQRAAEAKPEAASALSTAIKGFALGAVIVGGGTAAVTAAMGGKHIVRNGAIGAGVGGAFTAYVLVKVFQAVNERFTTEKAQP